MNWYKKYKLAYDMETVYLKRQMESGFDPYDYQHEAGLYVEEHHPEFQYDKDLEMYEIGEKWIQQATEEELIDILPRMNSWDS